MPRTDVGAATRATYVAFAVNGFAFASWASRIPQVQERLGLDPSELGLLLFAIAAGAVIALPSSGPVVGRFGSRRAVAATAVLGGAGLVTVAAGYEIGVAPVVVGLFMFGFANGTWDVSMNVQGAIVERGLGRAIMPRFHAGFSLGTVAGALVGAAMVALDIGVTPHLLVVGVAVAASGAVRGPSASSPTSDEPSGSSATQDSLTAWREPRTLLIGVFVLAFAFSEGAGNDWISVAVIDDYGADPRVGTLAFAAFLAAMTGGRWVGPCAARRLRARAGDPRVDRGRGRRARALRRSGRTRRWRSSACCCGEPACRSASRSA